MSTFTLSLTHVFRIPSLGQCAILATAWVVFAPALLAAQDERGDNQRPVAGDSVLFASIRLIAAGEPRLRALWAGFWSAEPAALLFRPGGGGVLMTADGPPADFQPITTIPPHERSTVRFYWSPRVPADIRGRLDLFYQLGPITVTAVAAEPDVGRTIDFLFHELFHAHQHAHFSRHRDVSEALPDSLSPDPAYLSDLDSERRLLADAMLLGTADTVRSILRQLLERRRARLASAPRQLRALEGQLERYEGTAELVGRMADTFLAGRSPQAIRDSIRAMLLTPAPQPKLFAPAYFSTLRWRLYGTGAALAHLLDVLGNSGWRAQVEAGAYLDEVISQHLGVPAISR